MLGDLEALVRFLGHVAAFRSNLLPRSFSFVFLLLGWLTASGIIWPLSALPGYSIGCPAGSPS